MLNAKKTLLLPIEIKNRELTPKTLLALECAKKGMRIYLGSISSINRLKGKISSAIYLYKGGMSPDRMKEFKEAFGQIIILDEEAGPATLYLDQAIDVRIHRDARPYIDKIICFNKNHRNLIHRIYGKNYEDIWLTGWPRIDLWRPENIFLYQEKVNQINSEHGDYILFPSNLGSNSKEMKETYQRSINSIEMTDESRKLFLERLHNSHNMVDEFIKLFEILSRELPDQHFIIRPHPAEDIKAWISNVDHLKNIKVIYEGEISPWVYASKGIIHYGCTTGVQSVLANLPTFTYKRPRGILGDSISFELSKNADTPEEMIELLKKLKKNKIEINDEPLNKFNSSVSQHIESIKGELAASQIAKNLFSIEINYSNPFRYSLPEHIHLFSRKLLGNIFNYFYRKFTKNALYNKRSPKIQNGINKQEIKKTIEMISPITNINTANIKCTQITFDLIEIELI